MTDHPMLHNRGIQVKVPGTSANIGPGFDAFGLAFNLYNSFTFMEKNDGKLTIRGVSRKYQGANNLVYRAMQRVFKRVHYYPKGLYIYTETGVPVSRGLGSSATCIVGGLVGANALCGSPLTQDELFDIAVDMEGHPDNIAPAMFGGLVCSIGSHHHYQYIRKEVADTFAFHLIVPDFELSTKAARAALPDKIPRTDGVFNVAHATMTYLALAEGRPDVLKNSMNDKLHEPYRKHLIRSFDAVKRTALHYGALGVCISGAGPTILAITQKNNLSAFSEHMRDYLSSKEPNWQYYDLSPDNEGTTIDFNVEVDL